MPYDETMAIARSVDRQRTDSQQGRDDTANNNSTSSTRHRPYVHPTDTRTAHSTSAIEGSREQPQTRTGDHTSGKQQQHSDIQPLVLAASPPLLATVLPAPHLVLPSAACSCRRVLPYSSTPLHPLTVHDQSKPAISIQPAATIHYPPLPPSTSHHFAPHSSSVLLPLSAWPAECRSAASLPHLSSPSASMELLKHMSLEQQSALLAQLKDFPASHLTNPLAHSSSAAAASAHFSTFNPAFYSAAPSPYPLTLHDELPHAMLLKQSSAPFPAAQSHSTASDSQYASMLHQFLREGRGAGAGAGGVEYGREDIGGSRSAEEESEGELSELSSDDISGGEEGSGRQRQPGRVVVKLEHRQSRSSSSQQPSKTAAAGRPVITVTSPPNSAASSTLTTPVRPLPQSKSSHVRPPSIRIPPPSILTTASTAPGPNGSSRSPLTPWSPFTPLSPVTPITPLTPQQSHQPAVALSSISAPAASHLAASTHIAAAPAMHLMPSHPPMVAPLSQSDMSPSPQFVLPQPSPLFQQQSYPQTPSAFYSSSSMLAEPSSYLTHTPSTPALFHQSSSASNASLSSSSPNFRNPFSSAPTPLLQTLSMPIGLSPMQSPFQSANSPYPFPTMSPPAVQSTRPLPSELIVNPHLAVSSSAPVSTTSATSSSSSSSSTTSRKRKLAAALPSSTSEDDSDSDSDAPSSSNPASEPVHNCPFTSCTKSFLKPSALKRHVRTHTGERPFVCGVSGCGLSFAERGNLKRHERVHSGLKPFRCEMCGHDFARRCHLMQHLKAKHPNVLLEE